LPFLLSPPITTFNLALIVDKRVVHHVRGSQFAVDRSQACFGSAIAAGGGWILLLIILGSPFLWRVGAEDKLTEQLFPNEYPRYEKRSIAWIPFVG
jgi:hypothetical protein